MNRDSLKIFLSCSLGAGIGTLIALQLTGYLWWIGMIAGGLIGYLSYEFKNVVIALRQCTLKTIQKEYQRRIKGCWQKRDFFQKEFIKHMIGCFDIFIVFVIIYILEAVTKSDIYTIKELAIYLTALLAIFMTAAILISIAAMLNAIVCFDKWSDEYESLMKSNKETIHSINPIRIVFITLPKFILHAILIAFCLVCTVLSAIWEITKDTFILIHSDIRLLCGLDAAIGVIIGYFAGNAIIGALAGGFIGVLNYEIFSKRIFHLVR